MYFDYPVNLVKKMREQNQQIDHQHLVISISDFSIDHILNRAGERCKRVEDCEECPKIDSQTMENFYKNQTPPQFDWLQNTRYRPPRLPRKDILQSFITKRAHKSQNLFTIQSFYLAQKYLII